MNKQDMGKFDDFGYYVPKVKPPKNEGVMYLLYYLELIDDLYENHLDDIEFEIIGVNQERDVLNQHMNNLLKTPTYDKRYFHIVPVQNIKKPMGLANAIFHDEIHLYKKDDK